jgi:hypothetical protein
MATAAVQHSTIPGGLDTPREPQVSQETTPKSSGKKDVQTNLNYYKANEDGSPPHAVYTDRPETYKREHTSHQVTIHDVRGDEQSYTLDGQGFQIHPHVSAEKDFDDDERIKDQYYAETRKLLQDVTGASRVFIFDHTIRGQNPGAENSPMNRGPVQAVHIDQSYDAAKSRVPHHLPEDAEELLKGRYQIINVWRPIRTVKRDPLAVAEAGTVSDSDLIVTGLIYPTRKGETLQVRYNPEQKWFYKSNLTPEEVILIKCFDSKTDGRARRVPHTAFTDPTAAEDAPARKSIEVRALVFHPDDRD